MNQRIFVKPAKLKDGTLLKVPYEKNPKRYVPESGIEISPTDHYWNRQLIQKSLVKAKKDEKPAVNGNKKEEKAVDLQKNIYKSQKNNEKKLEYTDKK